MLEQQEVKTQEEKATLRKYIFHCSECNTTTLIICSMELDIMCPQCNCSILNAEVTK